MILPVKMGYASNGNEVDTGSTESPQSGLLPSRELKSSHSEDSSITQHAEDREEIAGSERKPFMVSKAYAKSVKDAILRLQKASVMLLEIKGLDTGITEHGVHSLKGKLRRYFIAADSIPNKVVSLKHRTLLHFAFWLRNSL